MTAAILIIIIGLTIATQPINQTSDMQPQRTPRTINVALTYIKETSNYTSTPKDLDATVINKLVDMVEKEINDYCQTKGYKMRFDYRTYPVLPVRQQGPSGLPEIKEIKADGISLVIGHDSNVLIDGAYEYIHENDILMISPNSGSLFATIDDQFFTLVSPARGEVDALSALMKFHGYVAFVAFLPSETDMMRLGVDLLADSLGFNATNAVILYDVNSKNLKLEAGMLSSKLSELEAIYGEGHVCIVSDPGFYSPEETAIYLSAIETYPNLSRTRWVDLAGTPQEFVEHLPSKIVTKYRFAQAISWPTTGRCLDNFTKEYQENVGELPLASRFYEQAARHDAMWMLALSVLSTNSTKASTIKNVLLDVSRSYAGVLGNCTLNEYGSRSTSDFALFEWAKEENGMAFKLIGHYSAAKNQYTPIS